MSYARVGGAHSNKGRFAGGSPARDIDPPRATTFYDPFAGAALRSEWTTLLGTLAPVAGALQASALATDTYNMVSNPEFTADTAGWAAGGAGASIARVDSSVDPGADSTLAGALDKWCLKVTNGGAIASGGQTLASIIGCTYSFAGLGYAPSVPNTQVNAHELQFITTDTGTGEDAWEALAWQGVAVITSHPIYGRCLGANVGDVTYWDDLAVYQQSAIAVVGAGKPDACITANMISPGAAVVPRALVLRATDELNFVRLLMLPNTAGTDCILETVTDGARATLGSADIDWTPGGTDSVRVFAAGYNYVVEHMKAGAAVWTSALTGATTSFSTGASFGVQLFGAGTDAFADVTIQPR